MNAHAALQKGMPSAPIRLWDVNTGELIREFNVDFPAFAMSVALSPNGKTLAAGCIESGREQIMICLWDVDSGQLKAQLPSGDPVSLLFTPDGKTLVCATEKGEIDVWDVESARLKHSIQSRLGVTRQAALTPDGKTVALGSVSAEVRQWDVETGQRKLRDFEGHRTAIRSIAYSPSGRLIATAAMNGDVRLWDTDSGKQRHQFTNSSYGLLAFDPAGKRLATAGMGGGEVYIWDVDSGEQLRVLFENEQKIRQLAFTHDGKYVVAVGSNERFFWSSRPITDHLHVWDPDTGEHVREIYFIAPSTESMVLSPDGSWVVLGAAYQGMQVIDLQTGEQLAHLGAHEAAVNSLVHGNGLIASGSRDKTIRLWDPASWETFAVLQGHEGEIKCVAFSPDGRRLASCDDVGSIRLWDVKTRKQVHEFRGHEYACLSLSFSPDGKRLVTAMEDSTALIWEVPALR
jgi:WD40 repeat protein